MTLGKVKNGAPVVSADGTMLFDWADSCDGWAVQQHMKLHFAYNEGDESSVNSTVVTWESKDGKKYNFNIRRLMNGEEEESFRGRATMEEKGGVAHYTVPKEKKEIELSADAVFPSTHTEMILRKALAGEKLFTKPVYDGSDEEGLAVVSVFIGAKIDKIPDNELTPDLRKNPLLDRAAWPVRMAFYKPDAKNGEPDYEMDLVLQSNGVARSMTIDYGDFAVNGVLASVESAPESSCAGQR